MDLTLALEESRGTSGEGLFFQINPSRTILTIRTNTASPAPLRRASSATLPEGG
ncbi:MAG: hypothetical protein ACKN81_07435 [Pirellulaceae bacterium]